LNHYSQKKYWYLQMLLMICFHFQSRKVFEGIDNIIIKSLQSVQKIIINDKHCFEMYGYDVLLDGQLKP